MSFQVDRTKREVAEALLDAVRDGLAEHGITGVPLERVQDRVLEAAELERPEEKVEEPPAPDDESDEG